VLMNGGGDCTHGEFIPETILMRGPDHRREREGGGGISLAEVVRGVPSISEQPLTEKVPDQIEVRTLLSIHFSLGGKLS